MSGDVHVRICEGLGVKFPRATRRLKLLKATEPDNKVLECTVKANADFIITGNKRYFPFEEFRGSKIVTPREFINNISES